LFETSELEEVTADIRATKADIVRHEETILKLTDYLIKLQDKENILLTQRQAPGEIPHNSTTN